MCTSRIVFVCRVGERPRQDIDSNLRHRRDLVVPWPTPLWKSLPRVASEKKKTNASESGEHSRLSLSVLQI